MGAVLLFSVAWLLLGAEVTAIVQNRFFESKLRSVAKEERDAERTLRFMKETFMMDPTNFLHPESEKVKLATRGISDHNQVYDWVKANIRYEQQKNSAPSDLATLEQKSSNCFGVAAVTTSMLRAIGVGPEDVHIAVGELDGKNLPPHAWTEVRINGEWLVIDPTDYLVKPVGRYIVNKQAYLAPWPRKNLLFEYNDKDFRFDLSQ